MLLLYLLTVSVLAASEHLLLTALLSDAEGRLRFECWQMAEFVKYPTVGMAVPGGSEVTNLSYVVLPPQSSEGYHRPPHPMFFVLLSGQAHVTIPEHSDDELWISEGKNNLMIAADTIGNGHVTEYPSDVSTHALQIPFKEGRLPEHTVLHPGVCNSSIAGVQDEVSQISELPIAEQLPLK
ncbi:hypothetical protein HII31_00903 [Pseudocercospora fuligena]|uniref:Uncharacterized protein n=1 Tax=Pseudocercospora fuligena TaxID=685502 RepID=A0A8H6RUP3_9PEZI|nr:hypothetical protein HII31_00903 [Pseudocercospora fuligena]